MNVCFLLSELVLIHNPFLVNSEPDAKTAARRVARILQKQGYRVRFSNFRVVNVLGTCSLPFAIKIANFAQQNSKNAR